MEQNTRTAEKLPEAELEVMVMLWREGVPMTAGELAKRSADVRGWKSATVHVLLERLYDKGFVTCDKSGFKHLYSPLITEDEYSRGEVKTLKDRFFGGSAKKMIASFINADGLTDDDLDELSAMIRDRKAGKK